jgi:high-affinity iron transporter
MFANVLIGLREGLEASLIIAILVAALVRLDGRTALRRLWLGVGLAVATSIVLGVILVLVDENLSERAAQIFAGLTSLAAVALITWMIFWMARHARGLRAHLNGQVDRALATSATAVAFVAYFAVVREGLETVLFLWAGVKATGAGGSALWGGLIGLTIAALLGYLIYRGAVKVNLSRLFTWTGALLVVVAAGVLRYAVHEFQEAGLLPEGSTAIDVSGTIAPDSVAGTAIRGLVSLSPTMTWLEVAVWIAYLVITMAVFVATVRRRPVASPGAAPASPAANARVGASTG